MSVHPKSTSQQWSSRTLTFTIVLAFLLLTLSEVAHSQGYAIPTNCEWSDGIKESKGKEFECPDNQAMVGRKHNGDENGTTKYYCCDAGVTGGAATRDEGYWSQKLTESNGKDYICGAGTVMAGRKHSGDENGKTKYYCAPLYQEGVPLAVDFNTCEWSSKKKESDHSYQCSNDKFMLGRTHDGDENGDTRYYCCLIAD